MEKAFFYRIFLVVLFTFTFNPICHADDPDDENIQTTTGTILNPKPGPRPRTPELEITCFYSDGMMWVECADETTFNITVIAIASGQSIHHTTIVGVPFAVPFAPGTYVEVECSTLGGDTYVGSMIL